MFVGKNGLIPRCVYVAITPIVKLGMMFSDLCGVQEEHLCSRKTTCLTPRCVYVAMALVCSTGHGA